MQKRRTHAKRYFNNSHVHIQMSNYKQYQSDIYTAWILVFETLVTCAFTAFRSYFESTYTHTAKKYIISLCLTANISIVFSCFWHSKIES